MSQEITLTSAARKKYRQDLLRLGDGQIGRELFYHIKSRYRILYVRSPEEKRVISAFKLIAMSEGCDLFQWDFGQGMLDSFTGEQVASENNEIHADPEAALRYIIDQAKLASGKSKSTGGSIYTLLDFHHFLDGAPVIERLFKQFASFTSSSYIVIISPVFTCPVALEKEFTLIDFPPPSREEVKVFFDKMCEHIPAHFPDALKAARDHKEEILNSTTGLTITEAENAYAKSLVKRKTFDIPTILDEKKQIIRKAGILEYRDNKFSFDQIGGLDNLKEWLHLRRLAFKEDAIDFGLDHPKGVLLVGIPGTGKSMISDALAGLYEMPLLRLDIGALFSAHIGESEENTRLAIQTAEAIAPCILGSTVITINGRRSSIENVFNNELCLGGDDTDFVTKHPNLRLPMSIDPSKHTVVCLDEKRGVSIKGTVDEDVCDVPLLAMIRTKVKGKLVKIRTKLGREITVTSSHLLMNGEKNMKKAKDFCVGDSILLVDNNNIQGDIDEKENIPKT